MSGAQPGLQPQGERRGQSCPERSEGMVALQGSGKDTMPPTLGVLLSAEYPMTELANLGKLSEDLGYTFFWYVDARYRPE